MAISKILSASFLFNCNAEIAETEKRASARKIYHVGRMIEEMKDARKLAKKLAKKNGVDVKAVAVTEDRGAVPNGYKYSAEATVGIMTWAPAGYVFSARRGAARSVRGGDCGRTAIGITFSAPLQGTETGPKVAGEDGWKLSSDRTSLGRG